MTTLMLGIEEHGSGIRFEVQRGEKIEGEVFNGFSDEHQMNTCLIVGKEKIAIGINGNRMDEKTKWMTFDKEENWDIEPYYNDEFLINFFF